MYSKAFSSYYDRIMGGDEDFLAQVKQLVTASVPENASILELGCGTGSLLQTLSKEYIVAGLDNSQAMLDIAKSKVPKAKYYHMDMSSFSLPQKYDAIVCIFDSINHLTSFAQWQEVFTRVKHHLVPGGTFIFDMNTKKRMKGLAAMKPYVQKLNDDTLMCARVKEADNQLFSIQIQVFEGITTQNVMYIEEEIYEATFPIGDIRKELLKYFSIEKIIDPYRKRVTNNTGRIFFVCKQRK